MATLTNKTVASTYKDLLQVSNSNSGVDATLRTVEDGEGTSAGVQLSTTDTSFNGNYILKEEGRQNHVTNTMPAPSMHINANTYGFIDHNDKYDAGANDFSIEVRFKLETGAQLWLSHIQSWLVNGWVLRAYDGGSGSNVWRVRLNDGSGTLDYNPNATWEFGKWVHVVFTFDRSGNLTIYQDGVSVGTVSITSYSAAGVTSTNGKFAIDTYTGNNAGLYKDVDISNIRWHNRLLSADEVKHYYSGGSVPFKYQGAANTNLTSGTLVQGKTYKIATYNSNDDFTNLGASSNASGVIFTSSGTTPTEWNHSSVLIPIGCVIDLDPSGIASDKWLDKSGNDLHANMTNGAVNNAPSGDDGLVYEEGVHEVTITASTDNSWEVSGTDKYLSYVRIGNLVHVSGYLNAVNDLSASGNIKISLPYTSATGLSGSADSQWGFGSISHGGSTVSGMTSMVLVPENQSYFNIAYVQDDGTHSYFGHGNLDDNFQIRVGFSYRI